ncbi:MAG: toxin-antitoxin system protein [Selenomonadaceae bacterium]|nr:toxin-antitoxin system protein [Selenomonadaceae bacterium]
MATVTVNFSDEGFALIKKFADEKGITPSELLRQVMFDWLEDEEDLRDAEEAYQEYLKNPVTISHEDFWRELGLNEAV